MFVPRVNGLRHVALRSNPTHFVSDQSDLFLIMSKSWALNSAC